MRDAIGSRFEPLRLWMRALSPLAVVRDDEKGHVRVAFLTLAGFMSGHALLETARDALFLAVIPARQLPWVYLAIAGVALVVAYAPRRLAARLHTGQELTVWLVAAGLVTAGFWVMAGRSDRWVLYGLYIWSGALASLVVVRFWSALGALFTVTQAKRIFAVIGAGSVLGSIAGSALARIVTEFTDARHLVLAAAIMFLATAAAPRLLAVEAGPDGRPGPLPPSWDLRRVGVVVWQRPYLRHVLALIAVATVVFTMVDYLFKSAAARALPDEALGPFFASVYLALGVLSLGVQLLVVGRVVERFGVHALLAIAPVSLMLAGGTALVWGGLLSALLLRTADGALRHSMHRTGLELLFVPMHPSLRERVKAFIDVVGQRGGQAVGSIAILILLGIAPRESGVGLAVVAGAALWLWLARGVRGPYLDLFRQTLRTERAFASPVVLSLDLASLESLLATLNDPDDERVLAALDLLEAQNRSHVVPALILYHPSGAVVTRALDLLVRSGRTDFLPIVDRLTEHADPELSRAFLLAQTAARPGEAALRRRLESADGAIRATALAGLVAGGWVTGEAARARLVALAEHGTPGERRALALAVARLPASEFEGPLLILARDPDRKIRLEAVRAMRSVRALGFVPVLLELLPERMLRDEVERTLVALGPAALARLGSALGDPDVPHRVRRQVPSAVGRFEAAPATGLLERRLSEETDGMIRYKILLALGKARDADPTLTVDKATITRASAQTVTMAYRFLRWRRALEAAAEDQPGLATRGHRLLVRLLEDKQEHAVERLVRLLALREDGSELMGLLRGLRDSRPEVRASSRELLGHSVRGSVRESLLELVDDLYDRGDNEEPLPREGDYEDLVRLLADSESDSIRGVAGFRLTEMGVAHAGAAIETPVRSDPAEAQP